MRHRRSRSGGARRSPAPPNRARLTAALGLAVVAVLGGGYGIHDLRAEPAVTAPDLGAVPPPPLATATPSPGAGSRSGAPGPAASGPAGKTRGAGAAGKVAPVPPGAPVTIALPGQKVTAPVVPTGVRGDGELEIPGSVATVGWWVGSAPAGATRGSTVLAGHIDSAAQGLGAFAALREVTVGSPVVLTDAFGGTHAYTVTARRTYPKYALPRAVFTGAPLVLITCGGPFDASAGRYRDNIVVYATPS